MAGQTVTGPNGEARIEPVGPPGRYQTYAIASPLPTHWVPAACIDVGCEDFLNGWRTIVAGDDADFVRTLRGRYHFTEVPQGSGLFEFTFPAGQPCFKASTHRRRLEREPRFFLRPGDWRGNPSGRAATELTAQAWVDDFGENQERLADAIEKG